MKKTAKIISLLAVISLLLSALCLGTYAKDFSEEYFEKNYITTPSWVENYYDDLEFWHNDGYRRVVDMAELLTEEEEDTLASRISDLQDRYGYDVVIVTDTSTYGWYDEDQDDFKRYQLDFYDYFGYGLGDNFSGSILFICTDSDNRGWFEMGIGDVEQSFKSDDNINNINANIQPYLSAGNWSGALNAYLDDIGEIYESGTVSAKQSENGASGGVSFEQVLFTIVFCAIIGLVAGLISMGAAVKNMKTVAQATQANSYVVPGSLNITARRDHFLYMTQTRVYSPKEKKSSGGGSSSFSSGGHSGSGGGGRF